MIERRIPPCYDCGAWDDEREGCTMPSLDRLYACPLENIADAIQNAIVDYRTQEFSDEEIVQMLTKPDEGEED